MLVFFPMFFSSVMAVETLTLDPSHTYVVWQINHMGFSIQTGKWYASGTLVIDKDNLQKSQVKAEIKINEFITGIPELDKHLRGDEFFNVAKFPTANFVSDKVELTGKDAANVHGILTLHGISKPVVLKVHLNKEGESPITHLLTAGFGATATIKRSDFGINAYLPMLGDEVQLTIQAEANKPAEKKKVETQPQ